MSVDDDIDMQRPHLEPEDVQTSHDTDLFEDNEDNDESGAGNFMDALSQPPTSAVRIDKRARDEAVSEKHRFHEVDYLQTLRQTIHQEAQDSIEEQQRLAEEERERHIRDINEKTQQWEVALKEREKQENHAQEAQLKNVAEEMARHEAEISARKDKELTEELARREAELSVIKNEELEEHTEERRCLAEELARCEAELSKRKKQELEEHEKAISAEMEQKLQLEIEKLGAEKESELANMEQ
ncbi:hypothetical protein F4604DRAFT_1927480 [Suillus subluteus]|nr:hypothetical protein F4604DRAFT_1927480 [Suillus subluteus]